MRFRAVSSGLVRLRAIMCELVRFGEWENGYAGLSCGFSPMNTKQILIYTAVFLGGVVLANRVRALPVLNKLPSL